MSIEDRPRVASLADRKYAIYAVKLLSGYMIDLGTATETWRKTSELSGGNPTLGGIAYTRPQEAHELVVQAHAGIPKSDLARAYGISRETVYQYLRLHSVERTNEHAG